VRLQPLANQGGIKDSRADWDSGGLPAGKNLTQRRKGAQQADKQTRQLLDPFCVFLCAFA
jgi:hypothetical protein